MNDFGLFINYRLIEVFLPLGLGKRKLLFKSHSKQ